MTTEHLVQLAEPTVTPPAHDPQLVTVEGGPGRVSWAGLRELWHFREVLLAFAIRRVKVKYKQAAIGIGWAVIQPIVAALLFSLFLGRLAHLQSEGAAYLAFALTGMVGWTFFSSAVNAALESIVTDQAMLRKVYFPREILPISAVGATLIDLVPGLGTLLVVALSYGYTPHLTWLALPIPLLLLIIFSLALGLGLSCINVFYRDVRYVLPFILQLGLFATPVAYSLSVVPGTWRIVYQAANPVSNVIDGMRRIVLHDQWPTAGPTAAAYGVALLTLALSYLLFKRIERGFSDRI